MTTETIKVPDIGDFKDVEVIEIFVAEGDVVEADDPLFSVESDKSVMDIPAPQAGTVGKLLLKEGDKVSEGAEVCELVLGDGGKADTDDTSAKETAAEPESASAADEKPAAQADDKSSSKPSADAKSVSKPEGNYDYDVVVIGAGPGGYSAAFRAADLGLKVAMVERYPNLGGVCLNVGCIPSKALLHAAKTMRDAAGFADHGITFAKPKVDVEKLSEWKDGVVKKLTGGLAGMAKRRKVTTLHGWAEFSGANSIVVKPEDGEEQTVSFQHCIVACGSVPVQLPFMPNDDERVWDSTDALKLSTIPKKLLVVGGGIIGLEMATVYSALGTEITVVEMLNAIVPGADADLVKPLRKRLEGHGFNIHLKTSVTAVKANKKALSVTFEGDSPPAETNYDAILVGVGRRSLAPSLNLAAAGLQATDRGMIEVDSQCRSSVPSILAIGDCTPGPGLAHRATHMAHVAAEVCAGEKAHFDARVIPSVAYTDPEIAWVGETEASLKAAGVKYDKGEFPWMASGRAIASHADDGKTKLLFDKDSGRIVGGGVVGSHAGDLIGEICLAIEMGCEAEDVALTVHAHPTLGETVGLAAEVALGTVTDI